MLFPFIHFNFSEVGTDVLYLISNFNNLSPFFFLSLLAKDTSILL